MLKLKLQICRKKTQWEDPRLTHPAVWRQAEMDMLRCLQKSFKGISETKLRLALIDNRFDLQLAQEKLTESPKPPKSPMVTGGKSPDFPKSPKSPMKSQLSSPKPFASKRESLQPDEFGIFFLKSRFSSVPEQVISDVLVSCQNDQTAAVEELTSMGFEDVLQPKPSNPGKTKQSQSSPKPSVPQSPVVKEVKEVKTIQLKAVEESEIVEVQVSPTEKIEVKIVESPTEKRYKGADPTLRNGPMSHANSPKIALAKGPDCRLHKGPDKALWKGPNRELLTHPV